MLPHTGLDKVRTESDGTEQPLPELRRDWFRASVTNAEPGFTLSISKSDNQGQGRGHRDRQKARERTKLKISWRDCRRPIQCGETAIRETELEKSRVQCWACTAGASLGCSRPQLFLPIKQEQEGGDPLSSQPEQQKTMR